jgi:hypothetical protein
MADYYTILTDIGLAKLANAVPSGLPLSFAEVAVGDGNGTVYNPAQGQTALAREVYRMPINQIYVDPNNSAWLVVEAVIPASVGGWYVREVGIYDDDGDLIAISKFPETYKPALASGAGKDLYLRLILEHSNVGNVTLQIDPAIVLATRKYVDDHAAITATTSRRGHVELATDAETQAGTDTQRAVTPASLSARTATDERTGLVELATAAEVQAGVDTQRAVTPAGLATLTAALDRAGLIKLASGLATREGVEGNTAITPAGYHAQGVQGNGWGYTRLPGRILIQAMRVYAEQPQSSFTWPIAFSSPPWAISATDDSNSLSSIHTLGATNGASTTTVTVFSRRADNNDTHEPSAIFIIGIGPY